MPKPRINLIHPPQPDSIDDRLNPPLGLLYMAAVLENHGFAVSVTDLSSMPEGSWSELIGDYDIYGITFYTCAIGFVEKIASIAKQNNRKSVVVVGGPHPSSEPDHSLTLPNVDVAVIGEGENAILELAYTVGSGGTLPKKVHHRGVRSVEELPLPARHLIDLGGYSRTVDGCKATTIFTSRGCPFNCSFCYKDIFGSNVRYNSPERVIREIKQVKSRWGYRHFVFWDDVFSLNRPRLYKICSMMKDLDIVFRCNGRVGFNTYDDFVRLRDAGCKEIAFGIESGSQEMLDSFNKKVTVEQNLEAIQEAQRAGLLVRAYMIVGFPGENERTIEETKRFIDLSSPDQFIVFTFVPFPGCDVWKHPKKYGVNIDKKDYSKFYTIAGKDGRGGIVFRTKDMDGEKLDKYRQDLIDHLSTKRQRGVLQPYMSKLEVYGGARPAPDHCIIIPVWNNRDLTKRCLDHIQKSVDGPIDIFILDNGSGISTQTYLESINGKDRIKVFRSDKNLGVIKGYNYLYGKVKGNYDYVIMMNNGILVGEPGWNSKLVNHLRNDPMVAVAGPVMARSNRSDMTGCTTPQPPFDYLELSLAALSTRLIKNRLPSLFDDKYLEVGDSEDADLSSRIKCMGYGLVHVPIKYSVCTIRPLKYYQRKLKVIPGSVTLGRGGP